MSQPQNVLPQVGLNLSLSQPQTSYKAMQFGYRIFTKILSCTFADRAQLEPTVPA